MRSYRLGVSLVATALLWGISAACHATTYYVSPGGSDSNSGTSPTSPLRTIQAAHDRTFPGDTVSVMNGTYTNANTGAVVRITRSGSPGGWIRYLAYPGHQPRIRFNSWQGFEVLASYIQISGFEIEGNNDSVTLSAAEADAQQATPSPHYNGSGIFVGKNDAWTVLHHVTVSGNTIRKCGGSGIQTCGMDWLTLANNTIYECAWYSRYAPSGISVYQSGNSDGDVSSYKIVVGNNLLYNNRSLVRWRATGNYSDGNGIILDDFLNTQRGSTRGAYRGRTLVGNNISYNNGGSGIHAYLSDNVDIVNNTLYGNAQVVDYASLFVNDARNCRLINNIVYVAAGKKTNGILGSRSAGNTYLYNLYYNGQTPAVMGAGDVVADPRFVNASSDPAQADFRLRPDSPARNSGYSLSGVTPTTDIAGTPRPQESVIDRGAYESRGALVFEAELLPRVAFGAGAGELSAAEASGGKYIILGGDGIGDYVEFTLPGIAAGTYDVRVRYRRVSNRGINQLSIDGVNLGSPVDQYGTSNDFVEVTLGTTTFSAGGDKRFRFTVVGKNNSSTDYSITVDAITLVPR